MHWQLKMHQKHRKTCIRAMATLTWREISTDLTVSIYSKSLDFIGNLKKEFTNALFLTTIHVSWLLRFGTELKACLFCLFSWSWFIDLHDRNGFIIGGSSVCCLVSSCCSDALAYWRWLNERKTDSKRKSTCKQIRMLKSPIIYLI